MAQDTVSVVNDLIETLNDGKAGFESAAADVKDPNVKATFNELASERAQLASELTRFAPGSDAKMSGSVSGAAHRGWMNLKAALGGGEKAILNEAERGEDVAVHEFEKALQEPLPSPLAEVVRRQYDQVKRGHDRVRNLRDSWK